MVIVVMARQGGAFARQDRANVSVRGFVARRGGCKSLRLASPLNGAL